MYHLYVGIRSFAIFGHSNQLSKPPQWVSATFLGKPPPNIKHLIKASNTTSAADLNCLEGSWSSIVSVLIIKFSIGFHHVWSLHSSFMIFATFLQPAIFVAHPSHFVLLERVTFGLTFLPSLSIFGFHTPLQPTAVDGPPVTWSKSNPMWVPWCKEKLTILWLLPNLGR